MKKIIVTLLMLAFGCFAYSSETPEGAVEYFFNSGYDLGDEDKGIEDLLVALDKINAYKIISSKVYKEKDIEYAILKVEMESPKMEDLSAKLISDIFKKLGDLYLIPEYRPYIKEFINTSDDSEEVSDKITAEIISSFSNTIKNSKFLTEKKTYELYVAKEDGEWYIPVFDKSILYDKKIEKYMKNNGAFYERYDATLYIDVLFEDFF